MSKHGSAMLSIGLGAAILYLGAQAVTGRQGLVAYVDLQAQERTLEQRVATLTDEEAQHQFGFLLGAFRYGAPPHGGIAFGFDRLAAVFGGSDSIRDFIAFPKNNQAKDTMIETPSVIKQEQLDELGIEIKKVQ